MNYRYFSNTVSISIHELHLLLVYNGRGFIPVLPDDSVCSDRMLSH